MTAILPAQDGLKPVLENSYQQWRQAILTQNSSAWKRATAKHRQLAVKNRILSEKRSFPASVFELPGAPPSIAGLKFLTAIRSGATANAYYFGKVDFGVGEPTQNNLLVISFVGSGQSWKYDKMQFVSLVSLPKVRGELAAGEFSYLMDTPELQPAGVIPSNPVEVGVVDQIAKIYVFCPGRKVIAQVNGTSRHEFVNAKEAELIIGGAANGANQIQFRIEEVDGGTGQEALVVRVYAFSQVPGVKPIKVYEYLVREGETPKPFVTSRFAVDRSAAAQLSGAKR